MLINEQDGTVFEGFIGQPDGTVLGDAELGGNDGDVDVFEIVRIRYFFELDVAQVSVRETGANLFSRREKGFPSKSSRQVGERGERDTFSSDTCERIGELPGEVGVLDCSDNRFGEGDFRVGSASKLGEDLIATAHDFPPCFGERFCI